MNRARTQQLIRSIVAGAQRKIHLQASTDAEPGRRYSGQQSMLAVWQGSEPAIQDGDARELPIRVAHQADDTQTSRGMRRGDILRPSRALEEAQYLRVRLRDQETGLQWKTVGTSIPVDASQECS